VTSAGPTVILRTGGHSTGGRRCLGGVPIAAALSLETGLPATFVRKEPKTYGTARLAEGPEIAGRRLLIVEDVISTGGQVAISAGQLRPDT
jgi:orotate phosphoribosyltransferase